ncbi:MAG: hypothetical protein ACLGPM_08905 [Acidobacteriota bacterium]
MLLFANTATCCEAAQPSAAATAHFDAYTQSLEARLSQQHLSASGFIAGLQNPDVAARLRNGEPIIENRTPADSSVGGALLHAWRGTVFVPGATAADCERLLRDYSAYPHVYAPEILSSRVLSQHGNQYRVKIRLLQKHVITVVMDTDYDVTFGQLDADHGYSASRSTHIAEISRPGTPQEHPLSAAEDRGFLWRLNIYWSWEQRDGGVYMQMETVTLTRTVPTGLNWLIGSYINKVPRQSLDFTLRATRNALQR